MEEFCVFPAIDGSRHFGTASPIGHFFLDCAFVNRDDDLASEEFCLGESPRFFSMIQLSDCSLVKRFTEGGRNTCAIPFLEPSPRFF